LHFLGQRRDTGTASPTMAAAPRQLQLTSSGSGVRVPLWYRVDPNAALARQRLPPDRDRNRTGWRATTSRRAAADASGGNWQEFSDTNVKIGTSPSSRARRPWQLRIARSRQGRRGQAQCPPARKACVMSQTSGAGLPASEARRRRRDRPLDSGRAELPWPPQGLRNELKVRE